MHHRWCAEHRRPASSLRPGQSAPPAPHCPTEANALRVLFVCFPARQDPAGQWARREHQTSDDGPLCSLRTVFCRPGPVRCDHQSSRAAPFESHISRRPRAPGAVHVPQSSIVGGTSTLLRHDQRPQLRCRPTRALSIAPGPSRPAEGRLANASCRYHVGLVGAKSHAMTGHLPVGHNCLRMATSVAYLPAADLHAHPAPGCGGLSRTVCAHVPREA